MRLILTIIFGICCASIAVAEVAEDSKPSSKLRESLEKMKITLINACTDKQECLDQVVTLMGVIWNNRDRKDVHKQIAACSATIAYKKGYVLHPKKMWEEMNADLAKSTALEICECVSDKWKNPSDVCNKINSTIFKDGEMYEASDDSTKSTTP